MESRPIATTKQLAEVVGKCAPPKERVKTLARVFQALRIEVCMMNFSKCSFFVFCVCVLWGRRRAPECALLGSRDVGYSVVLFGL